MFDVVKVFVIHGITCINSRVRSDMPFIPNGSDDKAFQGAAFNE